ncbi:MAG: copper chaperone [Rhodospirillaceae bacterium]|nr:MAG: copper chaperone [Rhodospirillaceae bacterium]
MTKFKVSDMTCGHCAGVVTEAVKGVDPKAQVSVDVMSKSVSITSAADNQKFIAAIREAGYDPQVDVSQP